MMTDRRGEMGFLEAMVAMMIVITSLLTYMGAASALVVIHADPLDSFDSDFLDAELTDREVVILCSDYLTDFVIRTGANGISLAVTVPGGFSDGPASFSYGETDGDYRSRSFTSPIVADHGRVVIAVFEVTLWYRTDLE